MAIIAAEFGAMRGVSCSSTSNTFVGDGPIRSMSCNASAAHRLFGGPFRHRVGGPISASGKPLDGGGDPFVGGGQRDSNVMRAARSVELAGRDEDSALREPATVSRHGSPRVAQMYSPASEWSTSNPPTAVQAAAHHDVARSAHAVRVRARRRRARRPSRPARASASSSRRACAPRAVRRSRRGRRRRSRPGSRPATRSWTASEWPAGRCGRRRRPRDAAARRVRRPSPGRGSTRRTRRPRRVRAPSPTTLRRWSAPSTAPVGLLGELR